jgi:hypothetical protein
VENNCPICNEPSICSCRCPCNESECKNGHTWHICVKHDKQVLGRRDHTLDLMTCTCNPFIVLGKFTRGTGEIE